MKIHRIAVVGCGSLAQGTHLPNIVSNPRLKLVAVCDLVEKNAEICRRQFGAERVETDWRRIVAADDIDLCLLATHTDLRGEFILPALEAGKPVYSEKPLAPSVDEMLTIVRKARSTGVPVCVGHNKRSSPAMIEFRRLLEKAAHNRGTAPSIDRSGERGPIPEESGRQILMRINDDVRSWKNWIFWDREGIIFAEMVHFVDLALLFNPGRPVRVFAEGSQRGNFAIVIRFDDGSQTTMHHSMVGHFDYPKELFEATLNNITLVMDQHLEVRQSGLADEKLVKAFPFADDSQWASGEGISGYMQSLETEIKAAAQEKRHPRWIGVDKGHARHLNMFLDCIEGRGENPCDVESAVPVNRLTLKILDSVRLGLPVAVGPADWHVPESE